MRGRMTRLGTGFIVTLTLVALACTAPRGEPAPDFTIPLYPGQEFQGKSTLSLADLRGRPVVANFWAPSCPPCRAEMPGLERTWQAFREQGVVFVGIDVGVFTGLGTPDEAVEFLQEIRVSYPVGLAQTNDAMIDYRVLGLPATFFITGEGKFFISEDGNFDGKWLGAITEEKLVEFTQEMLQ